METILVTILPWIHSMRNNLRRSLPCKQQLIQRSERNFAWMWIYFSEPNNCKNLITCVWSTVYNTRELHFKIPFFYKRTCLVLYFYTLIQRNKNVKLSQFSWHLMWISIMSFVLYCRQILKRKHLYGREVLWNYMSQFSFTFTNTMSLWDYEM